MDSQEVPTWIFEARFPVPFGLQRILSWLIQKLQRFSEAVPPVKFHQSAIHSFLLGLLGVSLFEKNWNLTF